nr:hypothetical protein [uncultured Dongia sp.]
MPSYTMGFRKIRGAEHRRDKRLQVPVFEVGVGERSYDTVNWSLGGVLLRNYQGQLYAGMKVHLHIRMKASASRIQDDFHRAGEDRAGEDRVRAGLGTEALVVRHDRETHQLALKFMQLTPDLLDFFERSFNFHNRRGRPR